MEIGKSFETILADAVNSDIRTFIGIPRSIIENKAEHFAELFVASNLDSDNPLREGYKEQYKEMFIDAVKTML